MMDNPRPTFSQVFLRLQANGPARVVSSRGTEYQVSAEARGGVETIIGRPRSGQVRIHADCWGDDLTCQRTRAGGIFNGDPSIYDWYRRDVRFIRGPSEARAEGVAGPQGLPAMRRFWKDDPGYVAWLAAHPMGYVLNTYAHVTSAYLILHRASCRTVNRPLAAGRSWTYAYGKACSDDRAEIDAWALHETGKAVSPCGHCLPGGGSEARRFSQIASGGGSLGSRAPRPLEKPVTFQGEPVRITIRRTGPTAATAPPLVIEGAQWLSETFFRRDPSATGANSYDAWIAETQHDLTRRDRIIDGDVTAVNRTMAARAPHMAWAPIVAATDWAWLEAINPTWDLFEMPDDLWNAARVSARLEAVFAATKRPGLHLAVITKILHIKRPRMFPVLDSVVVAQVGAPISDDITTWVSAMTHVRAVGRSNLAGLIMIREHLEAQGIRNRSLVRILDGLLWVSSPGAGLFAHLTGWERVIRPEQRGD